MCKLCNDTGWRLVLRHDPVLYTGEGPEYWEEIRCECQQEPTPPSEVEPFEEPPDWLLYSQQKEE